MAITFNDEYDKMDQDYGDRMEEIFGPTLLGFPEDVDSSRLYMFTSNLKQILTLDKPDIPRIMTGYENPIGKVNRGYRELKGEWEVIEKIEKYPGGIYSLVLYNKLDDMYDVVEKIVADDLTEKFGVLYDTAKMDSLEIGDKLRDEVLYKSSSYDDNMNYRLGKNCLVAYITDNSTLEDAIKIRRGFAESVHVTEVDTVSVSVNNNDVMLNIYGDDDEYKTFPNIGEQVNHCIICATRRVNNNHILYDFQSKNMRELYSTDVEYYTSKGAYVYDINVYYNNEEEFPNNIFYKQLKYYYDLGCEYAKKVYLACKEIKRSGSNYTNNVTFYKSKFQHYNDPEYKWKNREKQFGNIIIEFKTKSLHPISEGFKMTGRYGDKGVCGTISPKQTGFKHHMKDTILDIYGKDLSDEDLDEMNPVIDVVEDNNMPYLADGRRIDLLLNASGAIRRLNPGQLYEVDLNFIGCEIQKKIQTFDTLEEKAAMVFRYLELVNEDQYEFFYNMYNNFDKVVKVGSREIFLLDRQAKEDFIRDIEVNGFYLVKPPDANIRYDTLKKIYIEFPWIKPYDVYVDMFGIKGKKIMSPMIVGEKYMYLLKQTSNKNFSARSTGRIDKRGLPARSNDKKVNLSQFSTTPVKIGEAYNLFSAISGLELAEYNIFMRSSPIGRKSLKRIVEATGNPFDIRKLKVQDNFINVNAVILNAYLKALGIRLNFVTNDEKGKPIVPIYLYDHLFMDYPDKQDSYRQLMKLYTAFMTEYNNLEDMEEEGYKRKLAWYNVFMQNEDYIKTLGIDPNLRQVLTGKNFKGPLLVAGDKQ